MSEHALDQSGAPSVPPKKKRSIIKNRPAWAATNYSSPSTEISPGKARAARADTVQNQNGSAGNVEDDDFFNRANETLRHFAGPAIPKAPPQRDLPKRKSTSPAREVVHSDGDDDGEDVNLKTRDQKSTTSKRPRSGSEEDNGLANKLVVEDDSEELYGRPNEASESNPSAPVVVLSDDEDSAQQPLSPAAQSTTSDTVVFQSVEPEPTAGSGSDHSKKEPSPKPTSAPPKDLTPPTSVQPPSPPKFDPVLAILVTSPIPGTEALIARRHYQQRLGEVRKHWCKHNKYSDSQAAAVFLTWRGKRVFDFTNCKSLGIKVNDMGEVWINGQCQPPGPEGSQIEMEAVTTEILEQIQKEKEERESTRKQNNLVTSAADLDMQNAAPEETSPKKESQALIILRAKDYKDYKLLVRQSTPFSKIISAFCKSRNVPADKTVTLVFEGDKLDPEQKFQNSEVSHRDTIDVYIR